MQTTQTLQYDHEYTREVLVPDAAYYGRKRFGGCASLTWTFPLNLGKAGLANGYVRLGGGYRKALPEGSRTEASITVGLFTF